MKKRVFLSIILILLLTFSFSAYAEDNASTIDNSVNESSNNIPVSENQKIEEKNDTQNINEDSATNQNSSSESKENSNVVVERGAGITPDSFFYFLEDRILSKFRSDISNREKKIAEFREMIKEGKIDSARESLERYRSYADSLEKEVSPEDKEEAQETASAIRNTIRELEDEIPKENKKEFVEDVIKSEDRISKAAEVANKIKELCESLSKLDPEQYAKVCKLDENEESPKWQRSLDKKLTEEQREEAEEFFSIMSQCFENPKECQCNKIKIKKFSDACSEIAPLAAKCEEGDEDSCKKMDEIEDPIELLPPHLQDVMGKVESRFEDSKHDKFAPPECRKAKATSRESCMKIMFEANAPEECIEALNQGKIDFSNERAMRQSCEKIMFEANAPEECIEAGLKDHKECGKFMFKQNAPQECVEAGLTGDSPRDNDKCRKIMEGLVGKDNQRRQGPGPQGFALGKNCAQISDKDEKLKCFEDAFSSMQRGPQSSEEFRHDDNYIPQICKEAGVGSNTGDDRVKCEKIIQDKFGKEEFRGDYNQFGKENEFRQEDFKNNFPEPCKQANALEPDSCRKIMEEFGRKQGEQGQFDQQRREEFRPPEGFNPNQNQHPQGCFDNQGNSIPCSAPDQQFQQPPQTIQTPEQNQRAESKTQTETKSEEQTKVAQTETTAQTETASSTSTTSGSSETSGTSGTTGSTISGYVIKDNPFLKYYFRS